jgi:hypothetical protein
MYLNNMVNYQFGQIYKIWSPSHPEAGIYYGSTCQQISTRIAGHRKDYKLYLEGKFHYISSFNVVKYEDFKYERVCYYPCNSKKELCREEGRHIQGDSKACNKYVSGRTQGEYIVECKDRVKKSQKEYRENNKERRNKDQKIYYEKNKEILKEKGKKYSKKYRENNKEKIKREKKIIINCICGSNVSNYYKKEHEKTKKHIKYIISLPLVKVANNFPL